jgi:hypothetical protein
MERISDTADVFLVIESAEHAIYHVSALPCVDEQHFTVAGTRAVAGGFVARQKPDTGRNLRVGKQLTGKATIHSTKSASIIALRISPSLLVLEPIEPLASSKAMLPLRSE